MIENLIKQRDEAKALLEHLENQIFNYKNGYLYIVDITMKQEDFDLHNYSVFLNDYHTKEFINFYKNDKNKEPELTIKVYTNDFNFPETDIDKVIPVWALECISYNPEVFNIWKSNYIEYSK